MLPPLSQPTKYYSLIYFDNDLDFICSNVYYSLCLWVSQLIRSVRNSRLLPLRIANLALLCFHNLHHELILSTY